MRRITATAVALLMLLAHNGIAQDREETHEDVRDFFSDSSPALLFSIDGLTLRSWEAGIGIMIPGNERFQWRFGLNPSLALQSGESSDDDDSTSSFADESAQSVAVNVAPIWLIGNKERLVLTLGPEVRYAVQYQKTRRKDVVHQMILMDTDSKAWSHAVSLGCRFGVGLVAASSLFIHAEYRLKGNYWISSSEYLSNESEQETWSLNHHVSFSLGVRL